MSISLQDGISGTASGPDIAWRGSRDTGIDAAGEFDLRGKLNLLRRQMSLIVWTIVVIVAATLATSLALTPIYSATALVLMDPSGKNLLDPSLNAGTSSSENARIDSETEIIRSDGLMMQVVETANLVSDPEFATRSGLRQLIEPLIGLADHPRLTGDELARHTLDRFKSRVTVQRRGLTHLIAITVRSEDSQKAADLANHVATTYIGLQVQAKIAGTLAAKDAINDQIIQARRSVVESETAFSSAIFNHVDTIVARTGRTDLAQLRDELEAYIADRSDMASRATGLRANLRANDWSAAALASSLLAELEDQRQQLNVSLSSTEAGGEAANVLNAQLLQLESELERAAGEELASLQVALAASDAVIANVRQTLGSTILGGELPPDILAHFYELQQIARNATSTYQALLVRLQDLDTQAALQIADSRLVSPALAASLPSFPNIPLFLGIAALFALAAGIGFAFLFENFIGGFTTPEQVEAVTRRRVGSVLPRFMIEPGQSSVADAITAAPLSRYAENVRRLRVMVDTAMRQNPNEDVRDPEGKVIMVASALPGEGKTTVALSLARTYAVAGQRVLVLDCDLRKPSIHKHLNVEGSSGLIEVLSGHLFSRDLSRVLVSDPKSSLTSIVGARYSDLPTDQLVAGKLFRQIIASARRNFDHIIIDSPPVEVVVDGLYLAQHADAVVFVIRWAKTPQRVVQSAIARLSATMRAQCCMVVALNEQDGKAVPAQDTPRVYYTDWKADARQPA